MKERVGGKPVSLCDELINCKESACHGSTTWVKEVNDPELGK